MPVDLLQRLRRQLRFLCRLLLDLLWMATPDQSLETR